MEPDLGARAAESLYAEAEAHGRSDADFAAVIESVEPSRSAVPAPDVRADP